MIRDSYTFFDVNVVITFKLLCLFQVGKINSIDLHRTDDLLVTASEDDSVRLYDIANAK